MLRCLRPRLKRRKQDGELCFPPSSFPTLSFRSLLALFSILSRLLPLPSTLSVSSTTLIPSLSWSHRKEQLNKIAPGYNPSASFLIPQQRSSNTGHADGHVQETGGAEAKDGAGVKDGEGGKQEVGTEDAFLSLKIE